MVQSAAPPIRPTREHPNEGEDAPQAPAPLPTQSLEDHRLDDRVERAVRATGCGALRTISVSVNAGVVMLGGRVSSYYLKQVAEVTALVVPGARQIRNGLDVIRPNSDRRQSCAMRQPHSQLSDPPDRKWS